MAGSRRLRSVLGLVVVLGLIVPWVAQPRTTVALDLDLPAWTGGVDLYRDGTFTTQKSWLWCTAAGVQIARNIVDGAEDHTTGAQREYFEWMLDHNRYDLPESAGVDPAGWTAGLRHFVDDRYRLVASRTFDEALRSAAERLRLTRLPVAITVSHGGHGWILTGFSATADPAATTSFKVTSVRVVGPLYGRQSKDGYDMAPNTELTPTQLKRFFTPWKYDPKPMAWDGRYVSIQPVPEAIEATAAPSPAPDLASATAGPTPTASPSPADTPSMAALVAKATPRSSTAGGVTATIPSAGEGITVIGVIAICLAALAILGAASVGIAIGRRRPLG